MPESVNLGTILSRRTEFKNFLASRLGGNQQDAEDLLQNNLAKALHAARDVVDQEKLVPWFYQLLRNSIVDHVRSRQSARHREETWTQETHTNTNDEDHRAICRCFESLLPTLKPQHAELLRRVEMTGENVSTAATALGLSASNASVILHRARKELRKRLEAFCGSCAEKSCFDCDCEDA